MASWRKFSERFKSGEPSLTKRLAEEDSLWSHGTQDSWIELGPPSRGSLSSSCVDAALLLEAQASRSHHSPNSLASPRAHNASGRSPAGLESRVGPPSRGSLSSSCVDAALLLEAQASRSHHSPNSLASPRAHNASGRSPAGLGRRVGPPSRGLLSSSCVDAALLLEAQASRSHHSFNSLASPRAHNASGPDLSLVNQKLLDGKPGGWVWDWSSRCEATPPRDYLERGLAVEVGSSDLTTPPNSPAPGPDAAFALRHSKLARSEFFRVEVVFGLVVSNLFTFFVGACLGYYISKKVGQSPEEPVFKY